MRIALVELHVAVPPRRRGAPASPEDAVARAIRRDPAAREALALEGIARGAAEGAQVVVCPGWTFAGEAPAAVRLAEVADGARVVFEVLDGDAVAEAAGAPPAARPFVFEGGAVRPAPAQAVSAGGDLDGQDAPAALARALAAEGRRVGEAVLLLDAEVNVVRRRAADGGVSYRWDPGVARAGVPASAVHGRIVVNPARLPSGSYVLAKRRAGPWHALVTTANAFDAPMLGLPPPPAPLRAIVRRRELRLPEPAVLSDGASLVAVVDVPERG